MEHKVILLHCKNLVYLIKGCRLKKIITFSEKCSTNNGQTKSSVCDVIYLANR